MAEATLSPTRVLNPCSSRIGGSVSLIPKLSPTAFAWSGQNCTLPQTEQYRTFSSPWKWHLVAVKCKELTPKQIACVPCPTCGAAINEVCELNTGAPRTEPHRDRKLSAADAVETKSRKR